MEKRTAKEKTLCDQALVASLEYFHDELDATRAAEEAHGQIRWLRAEFQAPAEDAL